MMLARRPIHTHSTEDNIVNPLVSAILNRRLDEANELIKEAFVNISIVKLVEMKKMVAARMYTEMKLDGIKPAYDQIEDRRKDQVVASHEKSDLPKQNTQPNTTVIKKTSANPVIKEDEEQLDESRFKIVRARIRGGKIQRRKKVSTVKGMTFRGGKLIRMSPAERRKRKMGARRAKVKIKSKRSRMQLKRKRSMYKRKAMGIR
jgi:hypothetical protein